MKTALTAFLICCTLVGCQEKEELPTPDPNPSKVPAGESSSGYLGAVAKASQSMEKTVDTAAINNALQLFAVEEGRIPESLEELVEKKYLEKLPAPPVGTRIQYDKDSAKVSIVKQ